MATEIGKLIRQMRKAAGMSQTKLAEKLGITYQQVQKYEYGVSKLSVGRLLQISRVFEIDPLSFVDKAAKTGAGEEPPGREALAEDEARLLLLFRRLKSEKLRGEFINMVENIASISGLEEDRTQY